MVKNLPAIWETQVQSLGCEDALEKGMATHSSILAWRIPWTKHTQPCFPRFSNSQHMTEEIAILVITVTL